MVSEVLDSLLAQAGR